MRKRGLKAQNFASLLDERDSQYQAALDWCKATNKGADAACRGAHSEQWPMVKASTLRTRLQGKVVHGRENESRQLIAAEYERQLVEWILFRADHCDPVKRDELRRTVGDIVLKLEQLRKAKIPTPRRSQAVKLMLETPDKQPSRSWVIAFNLRHRKLLKEGRARVVDSKRANILTGK